MDACTRSLRFVDFLASVDVDSRIVVGSTLRAFAGLVVIESKEEKWC